MIRGWSTEIRSWRGRDGIRILGSGSAVLTCRSDSASESVGSAALGGVGVIGDSTGITITQLSTMVGITPGAGRFTTETPTTEVEADAVDLMAGAADSATIPEQLPDLSTEIAELPEDTPSPAIRAASAQVHSAATTMAERRGATRHAEAPASVAAEAFTAAEAEDLAGAAAGDGNRTCCGIPD